MELRPAANQLGNSHVTVSRARSKFDCWFSCPSCDAGAAGTEYDEELKRCEVDLSHRWANLNSVESSGIRSNPLLLCFPCPEWDKTMGCGNESEWLTK